jgi:hypothetical protein
MYKCELRVLWHTADTWHRPQSCLLCCTCLSWVQFWERGQMLLKITPFCLGVTSCLHTIICHRLFVHLIFVYVVVTACVKQPVVLRVLIVVPRCFTVLLHCNSHFIFLSWKVNISLLYPGGAQHFQKSRSHLKIFGARREKFSMSHSYDPQILGGTSQNLVTQLTWCLGFVYRLVYNVVKPFRIMVSLGDMFWCFLLWNGLHC